MLLSTACVNVLDNKGNLHTSHALLDSESKCIKEELCKRLGLKTSKINVLVTEINQCKFKIRYKTEITIHSHINNYSTILSCLVLPKINDDLPPRTFDIGTLPIPENITLQTYILTSSIDLLIGSCHFRGLLSVGQLKLRPHTLQHTKLGWIAADNIVLSFMSNMQNHTYHWIISLSLDSLHNELLENRRHFTEHKIFK